MQQESIIYHGTLIDTINYGALIRMQASNANKKSEHKVISYRKHSKFTTKKMRPKMKILSK